MIIDALQTDKFLKVKLPNSNTLFINVRKELSIDTDNLREEILTHPARTAMINTLVKLSNADVRVPNKQQDLLQEIAKAFEVKKEFLMTPLFLSEGEREKAYREYSQSSQIIKLRALVSA